MATIENLTAKDMDTFSFCIKMGDTVDQALRGVDIDRKKRDGRELYEIAYHS